MQQKKVTIHAPATVANLVCGFDVLGMCIDAPFDVMEVELINTPEVIIKNTDSYHLPTAPHLNAAGAPLLELMLSFNKPIGFKITSNKNIKPGSGLGSSAASAAGAVVAANYLLGNPFSKNDLVRFAMAGEKVATGIKHADNVAPCIYGGVTVIRSIFPLDVINIDAPPLYVTVVHPQIEIKTADARQILRKEVLLKDAIKQWGNIAGLVAGFMKKDVNLIANSLEDVIIEPIRSILIPRFDDIKQACKNAGALGGGIAGSGPSIFMLSETKAIADTVAQVMQHTYTEIGLPHFTYVSQINNEGVKIIQS
ncbi:homoserine kinase [Ferruginibacter yonginensis]|uniref:Homoserine kinase n=1 Tax=Ferruginibacter yonginensis TaxID=1310416 RepID=A0ABV8QTF1_9BACT